MADSLVSPSVRRLALFGLFVCACHSPGPFGFSPNYVPQSDEERALAGATEYDPVMAQRDPEGWRKKRVTLFGVVTTRGAGPGGGAYLTLSVRRLEPRNLCENANDEDSCRVTVSDRDFGIVHAVARLSSDDDYGPHSLSSGSLVRVVGAFGEELDPSDGAPVLRASYYRHWPRNFYVTRASAVHMRQ
jgi:hypothetical protein